MRVDPQVPVGFKASVHVLPRLVRVSHISVGDCEIEGDTGRKN